MSRLRVDVQHSYEHFELDVRFDLEFRRLALFGPSGAGKTTLLKVLSGLLTPRQGLVELGEDRFLDTDIGTDWPARRRRVGYLMQGAPLLPHLNVEENLHYSNRLSRNDSRGQEILELLEITSLLNQRPAELSGGERRRVALAQVLFSKPRLLLLDEPLTGLNETLRKRILPDFRLLLEKWERPSIVVSHRPEVVSALCDRVVPLKDGRGRETLTPPALFRSDPHRSRDLIDPTNYYRVRRTDSDGEDNIVRVRSEQGLVFQIPGGARTGSTSRMVLEFSADEPVLGREVRGTLSPRNRWTARIEKIEEEETSLLLILAIDDERMWVRVTRKTGREFGLTIGDSIEVFLKTQSIHVHPA